MSDLEFLSCRHKTARGKVTRIKAEILALETEGKEVANAFSELERLIRLDEAHMTNDDVLDLEYMASK